MYRQFIWHTGCSKTGSSHLQRVLFHNKDVLLKNEVSYLYGCTTNSEQFFSKLNRSESKHDLIHLAQKLILEQHTSEPCKSLVISYEAFANCRSDLISTLAEQYGTVSKVVQYFRSPASHAESAWKQWHMLSRKWDSFKQFADEWQFPNWARNLEIWKKAGAELKVCRYKPNEQSVVDQFLQLSGFSFSLDTNYKSLDHWGSNESFNAIGTAIAKDLMEVNFKKRFGIQNFLSEFGRDLFFKPYGSGFDLFSPEEAANFNNRHEKMIRRVENITEIELFDAMVEQDLNAAFHDTTDSISIDPAIAELIRRMIKEYYAG